MRVSLPDLGPGFRLRGVNGGNDWRGVADGESITIRPGVYLLTGDGASADAWTADRRFGALRVGEFVAPPPTPVEGWTVLHDPVREAPDAPLRLRARVVGAPLPDAVEVVYTTSQLGEPRPQPTMHSYRPERLPMRRVDGYTWEAVIPDSVTRAGGGILYHVVVEGPEGPRTWPGSYAGRPGDWDYTNEAYWSTRFVAADAPLQLLDPDRDYDRVLPLRTAWRTFARKRLVPGSTVGSHAIGIRGRLSEDDLLFLREYVGDEVRARREHLPGFTHVVVRARARSPETRTLQLGLLTTDGYTYAAPLELTEAWTDVRIPLAAFRQTGTALRLAYPQMMPDFFVPERAIPFDPRRIEKWEISTADAFDTGLLDFEVENIWLER